MNGMNNLVYALLGLVILQTFVFVYFSYYIFDVLCKEINKANKRADALLDRQMATNLTEYTNIAIRKELIEQEIEHPQITEIPKDIDSSRSYSGGMFE